MRQTGIMDISKQDPELVAASSPIRRQLLGAMGDGSDTLSEATFSITVTGTNDAPTLDVNSTLTVAESGTETITTSFLDSSDVDNDDDEL